MGVTETDAASGEVFGRQILIALGVGMILLGGVLGFIVGANGGATVPELLILGILTVPVTPGAMGLYGMAVVGLALGGLYVLISLASRYDTDAG